MSVNLEPSSQLAFQRPFTQLVKRTLRITNPHGQPVAFKVKTTAPKQYCVRPNMGKIDPGESVEVQVLLQPMKEDPPLTVKCKDKFLVQSTFIPAARESRTATPGHESSKIYQQKFKVVYLPAVGVLPEEDEHEINLASLFTQEGDSRFGTVRQYDTVRPNGNDHHVENPDMPIFDRSSTPPVGTTGNSQVTQLAKMSDHCSGPAGAYRAVVSKTRANVPPPAYYEGYDVPYTASHIDWSHTSARTHISMQKAWPLLPPRAPKRSSVNCTSDHLTTFVKIVLAWVIVYVAYSRIIIPTEVEHYKTLYDVTRVKVESVYDQVNQLGRSLRDAKVGAFWEMARTMDTNMDVWVRADDPGAGPKFWSYGITSGRYNSNNPPVTSTKFHFTADQAAIVESTEQHRIAGYKVESDSQNNSWWIATGLNEFGQAGTHQVKFSAKAPVFGSAEYDVDIYYAEWKG